MSEEQGRPQKKIKLILSDLYLGKGLFLDDGGVNSLEDFYFDEKLSEFIQFYSTGAFKNYDVELILNGDFLNFLQVDYKGHHLTTITEAIALSLLKSIVAGHQVVFKALSEFLKNPYHKLTYIIGNQDQPMLFQACKDYLNQVCGAPIQYKSLVYVVDGIHIEHGHMFEAFHKFNPRKFFIKKEVVEPILNLPFGSHLFIDLSLKIKEEFPQLGKVGPFSKLVKWLVFNETTVAFKSLLKALKYFYKTLFSAKKYFNWSLKNVLKIYFESLFQSEQADVARKILAEDRIHSVVLGHTMVYEYRKLGPEKEFFNAGTWLERTSLDIASLGRLSKMTYVLFEYSEIDSTPKGRLKEWKGFHRIEEDVVVS